MRRASICLFVITAATLSAADYKAGIGRIVITPEKPVYLSGYADRKHASEGKAVDLWAKALAIEDNRHHRIVIVTTDLIGLPRSITDPIAARLEKQYGFDRSQIVFSSSHTHTGPLIRGNLELMFELAPEDRAAVNEYAEHLSESLFTVVGAALKDLSPAQLSFGNGEAHFAINRRQKTDKGVRIGENPGGPADPDVPVLKVTAPDGKVRAVLFGYACHNTTLTGQFYRFSGDYAGFAQAGIEKANPGATALFMMLCGADQNPAPRSKLELAEQHGEALAAEVNRVLAQELRRVRGNIRTAFQIVELGFSPASRETFESRLHESNVWRVRHAKAMMAMIDQGRPIRRVPYPVQAIAFGKDMTMLTLGGEVVVDYVLRIKKEYGSKGIMVAAYCNDVMSYIPSLRVLREGGYEATDSMIYYGLPGPYDDQVEEKILTTIHAVMKRVGK